LASFARCDWAGVDTASAHTARKTNRNTRMVATPGLTLPDLLSARDAGLVLSLSDYSSRNRAGLGDGKTKKAETGSLSGGEPDLRSPGGEGRAQKLPSPDAVRRHACTVGTLGGRGAGDEGDLRS
jgi:hypothetical protein